MRVVAGEEGVVAQRTETSAARGQPVVGLRGEAWRVTSAATPLARRYLGGSWRVWERHLKQQEQTPATTKHD